MTPIVLTIIAVALLLDDNLLTFSVFVGLVIKAILLAKYFSLIL